MQLSTKIWIEHGGKNVFGGGRAALVEAIEGTGSISAAARQVGMSYRRAWTLLRTTEQRLGAPLLQRDRGGVDGGGSRLTPLARKLLKKYRMVESRLRELARKQERQLQDILD